MSIRNVQIDFIVTLNIHIYESDNKPLMMTLFTA